jgi:hypothetical protein
MRQHKKIKRDAKERKKKAAKKAKVSGGKRDHETRRLMSVGWSQR